MSRKPSMAARRKARRLAVQALYQKQLSDAPLSQIEAEFAVDHDMSKVDQPYFKELLQGVTSHLTELDACISQHTDRTQQAMTPVELAILRMGAYELKRRLDVPYKVVINESVELSKLFGASEGHRYVNGVLDKLAHQLRVIEVNNPSIN